MKQTLTEYGSGVPIFQHQGLQTLPGGYQLDTTGLVSGSTIPGGSAFSADDDTRIATLIKTATMQAVATNVATTYRVVKGSHLAVGDVVASGAGVKAVAITAIDDSNAAYDTVTLSETLGYALAAGDTLVQADAAGATATLRTGAGLSYQDYVAAEGNSVTLCVAGAFYARRIPAVPAEVKAALPNIILLGSK